LYVSNCGKRQKNLVSKVLSEANFPPPGESAAEDFLRHHLLSGLRSSFHHCGFTVTNFSDTDLLMSKKKSPPTVALQSVFVHDYQRRLRLVIELLEKEVPRQSTPPTNLQSQTENPRAFTVAPNNPGGK
jgi:hypothetical protein